mmetsp:Transcript_13434/g.17503  ORF Transcript_13434/g.17503 Transcript_13434/m.17503 type:complete len:484 (-) Transcript_13434:712-2163(-)|eukprot:CAMPEP_0184012648 /NCGR_PEP_ID=MMETSP0954-20121128/4547_1 /TAXON_ID=627963 /ORGANISM="Aplanochytrium sp, Strain PBS07" /LENGTH=483 /DNA_ID=CAMNT_0026292695 /DNA_START=168 /DNA_END=1619 /DNA_ORIENTATION=-
MGVLSGEDDSQLFDVGDGFPLVPLTELKVREMLAYTERDPKDIIGKCPPSYNECSIEKVAAVAVLSGCRPEYFPVILAAVECMLDSEYNLHGVHATTMGATPCLLVNGEGRSICNLNCSTGALGSGTRGNATMGRCLKLVLAIIGKAKLGGTESTTLGTPMKYGFCVAENEELLQKVNAEMGCNWAPLEPESSVTLISTTSGPHQVVDFLTRSADGVINLLAHSLLSSYNYYAPFVNECVVFLSPEHLETLSSGGVRSKEELARRLWKRCNQLYVSSAFVEVLKSQLPRFPILAIIIGNLLRLIGSLSNLFGFGGLGKILPKFNSPSSFRIVVTGGEAGKFSSFCPGFGVGKPGMPTYALSKAVSRRVNNPMTQEDVQKRFNYLEGKISSSLVSEIYGTGEKESFPICRRSNEEQLKGTIGLVDISKHNGVLYLDRFQELLEEKYPLLKVKRYSKETFSRPSTKSLIQKVRTECNYVIQGLAD